MKKCYQIIGFCFISSVLCSDAIGQIQREGVLNHMTNYPIGFSAIKEYPLEKNQQSLVFR